MTALHRPELRLPDYLVHNRNFVLLWLAYGVAAIGDHLSEMALLQVRGGLERPDATRIQALISFGFFLPFVLFGPIAGWWSDRFSRKTTMILADVLRGVIVFNLASIVLALERLFEPQRFVGEVVAPPQPGWGDFSIVLPLALVGALAAFFSPARQALIPTLIRDDQLVRANALINALGTIGGITGGVLGGKLVDWLGPGNLHHNYHLNALTFAISAAFVSAISMRRTRAVPHAPLQGVLTPILLGFRYVRTHARILQLIGLGAVFWGAAGIVISVVPAVVRDVFGGTIGDVAVFRGLIVVGLAVGAGVMSVIGPALPLQLGIALGLFGGGFWVLALDVSYLLFATDAAAHAGSRALSTGGVLTGICLFGIGGAGASILVSIMATIQRLVPDSTRGRVFGVSDTATMGAMVLTSGVLGLAPIRNLDSLIPWLLLLTTGLLWGALLAALQLYDRPHYANALRHFFLKLNVFYARFVWRVRRGGRCTVPTRGAALLVADTGGPVDPLLMLAASPNRTISFLAAERHFSRPVAAWLLRSVGCVRVGGRTGKRAAMHALRTLRGGGVVGVFVEPAGAGADAVTAGVRLGRLVLHAGVPVIPCHVSVDEAPAGSAAKSRGRTVRFGAPLELADLRGKRRDRAAQQRAAEIIGAALAALKESTGWSGVP